MLTIIAAVVPVHPAGARESYQQVIDNAVAEGVPGVQALVMRGEIEWAGTAGFASVEGGTRLTLADRMRVASITKMVTYATIVELARQGRLSLDDKAVDRLPPGTLDGIPNAEVVTVRQLLEHMSGIHNFNGERGTDFFAALYADPNRGSHLWTARELIDFARRPSNPPTGAPGEARSYSSTGYIILEMVAEHVGGASLPELYRRLVFTPAGMRRSGVEGFDLTARASVDSYARPDDPRGPHAPAFVGRSAVRQDGLVNLSGGLLFFNAWARGAGAISSTACDLAAFMRGVLQGRFTVLEDQQQVFASAARRPAATFSWNGGSAGIQASILYAPAPGIVVVVLTNGTNAGPGSNDIATRLLDVARAQAPGPPVAAPCACAAEAGGAVGTVGAARNAP